MRSLINLSSAEIARRSNEYVKTWRNSRNQDEQNEKYLKLLVAIRKDLKINNGDISKLPEIELVNNIKFIKVNYMWMYNI